MNDTTETIEIEMGSDNVFADLGLPDAPELKLKSAIAGQVASILQHRHLTQQEAARILGVAQPKVSALMNGRLHGFSLEKLLDFMLRLDRHVEIGFRKVDEHGTAGYSIRAR